MPERQTLLFRPANLPTVQPVQGGAPAGAFGDYRGLIAVGQSLQGASQAGFAYAEGLKREMEQRTMQDYRLQADNALSTAVLGVQKEYERKLQEGDFAEGGSYSWLEENLATARNGVSEHLGKIASDPLFKKAVPDSLVEHTWTQHVSSLYKQASAQEGVANMQRRLDSAETMVGVAYSTLAPGQYGELNEELIAKSDVIDSLSIPSSAKRQLKRDLADRAFDNVVRGLQRGVRITPGLLQNARFSPGQLQAIEALNAKLDKPKELFANTTEAEKVLDATLGSQDIASDPVALQTAREAADFLASKAESPEAKRYAHARVDLKLLEQQITRNNFESLASVKGQKLYQRLSNLSAQLADPKTADALFESTGIKGADPKDRSRFIDTITSAVRERLDLINTGRANEVVDTSDAVKPIAAAAVQEFNSDTGFKRETAQRYIQVASVEYDRMGIPEDKRVYLPGSVVRSFVDRIWNGDTNNGSRMITNIGESFGSQALDSLAGSFLNPSSSPKDRSGLDTTKSRNNAYAALLKIAAADHARVEIGAAGLELQPALKQWLDDLGNFEKNQATFPRHAGLVAQKAFNMSSYDNPVSAKELLNLEQLGVITSRAQSLPGIAKGLFWQTGQNNDMAAGFQELMTRIIQSKAYSAGTTAGEEKGSREVLAANATADLNNMLARIYTVVPVSGVENTKQVYDLWPTKLVKEGALDLPKQYGAADVVDLGQQLSNVLEYVGYYEPRRYWERGKLADYGIRFANTNFRENPLFHSFLAKGSSTALPVHLQVDWARVDGITPEQVGTGGEKLIKDYLENPKTRYTFNSVAFTQNGAWRYNWKTGEVEAMIFPGRSSSPASPNVQNPGPAQSLQYNYGTADKPILRPVSLKAEDIRLFDSAYRLRRVIGDQRRETESQFVTPPLN